MPVISNFPCGSGRGGGIALEPVSIENITVASEKVYISWTDPEDLILDGVLIAEWDGTLLVRKAGSEPQSRRDGVLVLDSKVRNAYQDEYFCDSGLSNDVTYYYKFFPYTKTKTYTDSEANAFDATPYALPMGDVSDPNAENAGNGKLSITWQDPDDIIVNDGKDGIPLAIWEKTIVVVKKGIAADSPDDPDAVYTYTSTTRNAHSSEGLLVSGLENGWDGATYYVSFFPVSTDGVVNTSYVNRADGVCNRFVIEQSPLQGGTLTYNGTVQTPAWQNYDTAKMTLSGETSALDAGTYTAVFTPTEDYCWGHIYVDASNISDDISPKTVTWSIDRASIAIPSTTSSITYDGAQKMPLWMGYNSGKMTMSGDISGTDAGTYTTVFTPAANYQWPDGSTVEKTVSWTIAKAVIAAVPSQSGTLTYTGSSLTPTWANYNSSQLTISGTSKGTNAGTYTAAFTPAANYQWSDGTTTAKNISWSIAKATGNMSLSASSVTLNDANLTKSVTVTRSGNGTVTATSNNASVAAVSVRGTTVTINHVNKTSGTATITIKVAAGTNHTAPANKTVAVTATFVPALNDCTWAQISEISAKGQGANYWNVGDRKAVLVKGTVGTLSINQTLYVYILGFNHNQSLEGTGIHFGTFKTALTGGTDVCLVDSVYGNMYVNGSKRFNINHWGTTSDSMSTNYGGWKGCDIRYDILGSTNKAPSGYGAIPISSRVGYDAGTTTATSPVANTLMAALPSDLRAVMKPITKYTDNKGGNDNYTENAAEDVTASVDYLPLPAEYEIFGTASNGLLSNSNEKLRQAQYSYYSAGNSKIKYKHSSTANVSSWWERSFPVISGTVGFCLVYDDGSYFHHPLSTSFGIAPIFMV